MPIRKHAVLAGRLGIVVVPALNTVVKNTEDIRKLLKTIRIIQLRTFIMLIKVGYSSGFHVTRH
jgi:hypothetical protein